MASVFRGTIDFFWKLGIYDVILPFLLVYAVMYAVLEKTKVLGQDKDGNGKKSINAVVSFCTAFFVVASTKLVAVISQGIANVMLVIMMIFCFLLLASMFYTGDEKFELSKGTKKIAIVVVLVVVLCIFLYYIGWLTTILNFVGKYWQTEAVSAIIFMGVMVGLIAWMTHEKKSEPPKPAK